MSREQGSYVKHNWQDNKYRLLIYSLLLVRNEDFKIDKNGFKISISFWLLRQPRLSRQLSKAVKKTRIFWEILVRESCDHFFGSENLFGLPEKNRKNQLNTFSSCVITWKTSKMYFKTMMWCSEDKLQSITYKYSIWSY